MNNYDKVKKRLKELIREGCILEVQSPQLPFLPVRFRLTEAKLIWVNSFPESQHDVHSVAYAKATVWYDRDVALYDSGGDLLVYVAPFSEWSGEVVEKAKDEFNRWNAAINEPKFKEDMERFISQELSYD